jgi:CHAD domain-containing protein
MTQTLVRHRTDDVRNAPTPAQHALATYLNRQVDAILAGDLALRHGQDPIYDTRVAIRRLRSTVRVFHSVLDGDAVERAEADLKWFAALLGDVRDCQVQSGRFDSALTPPSCCIP